MSFGKMGKGANTMSMTNNTQLMATRENTVFLTVAAYSDYEAKTAALRKSAADHEVSLVLCDTGNPWRGFYHHKIERMSEHLERLHDAGKRFAFILDSRDVVFIEPMDSVLAKFNALNDGRVIFNNDIYRAVWPCQKDYLARAIEEAMGTKYARINAGAFAGDIETILNIQHHAIALRRELHEECPRQGMVERIYQDIGTKHINDDQHLYQICLTYYPELFRIDIDKELFAILMFYPEDVGKYSDNPVRHDVINNAAIIHSPWLSRNQEWSDRAFHNRWKRETADRS
jgi:hypothetical protein